MLAQRAIDGLLGGQQVPQLVGAVLRWFGGPQRAVGQQGWFVHQDRVHWAHACAGAVDDGVAVGVDVAPIDAVRVAQPRNLRQQLDAVAEPHEGDRAGQIGHGHGEVADVADACAQGVVEDAHPYVNGRAAQAAQRIKAAVSRAARHAASELRQDGLARINPFRVQSRDGQLAQVQVRRRMGLEPRQRGHEAFEVRVGIVGQHGEQPAQSLRQRRPARRQQYVPCQKSTSFVALPVCSPKTCWIRNHGT